MFPCLFACFIIVTLNIDKKYFVCVIELKRNNILFW